MVIFVVKQNEGSLGLLHNLDGDFKGGGIHSSITSLKSGYVSGEKWASHMIYTLLSFEKLNFYPDFTLLCLNKSR